MLLSIYLAYAENRSNGFEWCKENSIDYRSMQKADDIVEQLREHCVSIGLPLRYTFENFGKTAKRYDEDAIAKAFATGFFLHSAALQPDGTFVTGREKTVVYIHPTSCLFGVKPKPKWLIYDSIIRTTKPYMRQSLAVDAAWLMAAAPKRDNSSLNVIK